MYHSTQSCLVVIFVSVLLLSLMLSSQAQQFYPNGRYGRRDSMPALSDISGNREMTISFFGDGTVQCIYSGFADFYRCVRKLGNSQSSSTVVD